MRSSLSIQVQRLIPFLAGILFLSFAHGAKNPAYCWFPSPYKTYQEWMNAGQTAKSSKRKICCYSKALSTANITARQKAEAYFQRGYATYYYIPDATGETWEASSPDQKDRFMDDEGGKSIQEEALVPQDTRRETGFADYKEALKLNPDHSDSYFECGVYWYWKGYREEAKEKADKTLARDYYSKALSSLNHCIQRDKWCSTAYEIRSRIWEQRAQQSQKARDLEIRDKLRHYDDPKTGSGLTGYYCNGRDFTGLVCLRRDSQIAFHWGEDGPGGVGDDHFCIRWIGTLNAPSDGSYVFSTFSDDGVRLWLDNKKVIENWSDHAGTWNFSDSISLKKDTPVQIVLEFYENEGDASIHLCWTPPGGNHQVIPTQYLYPVPSPEAAKFPVFYQHGPENLTGWHLYLDKGDIKFNKGDFNNNLSYVSVPGLYKVQLYEKENFSGVKASLSGVCSQNLSYISGQNLHFNDKTSSVKVECKTGFGE